MCTKKLNHCVLTDIQSIIQDENGPQVKNAAGTATEVLSNLYFEQYG